MSMMKSKSSIHTMWRHLGLGAALLAAATQASAFSGPQDIQLSYAVTTPYAINNVITFNTYADEGVGSWWPSSVAAGGGAINDPFTKSSSNAPLSALILGLTTDTQLDSLGQTHVVLMVADAAAGNAQGMAWGTLFPTTDEATLAQQIQFVTGTSRTDGNATEWDASLNALYSFTGGEANAASTWFSLGSVVPGSTTTTTFSVLAFSDGQMIGNGVASLTATAAVPEPQTAAMMLVGAAALGSLSLRRRQ